jgi:hypothetical protein
MMILERVDGTTVARVLIALAVIVGRMALDRMFPRGGVGARPVAHIPARPDRKARR